MLAHDLQQKLSLEPQMAYPCHSRVHPLRTLPSCFIKREDELSFGLSGSKFRKYRLLIPSLLRGGCKEVVLIGSPFSNHILSLSQLLIESGIKPTLFLKGAAPLKAKGNFFFLEMLSPSIHWVAKSNWRGVDQLAESYAQERSGCIVIPEGGALFSAFLGALTLPLDILQNEEELGLQFDEIFIDAGTGVTAIALLLGFSFFKRVTQVAILRAAGTEEEFMKQLGHFHAEFERWLDKACPFPSHFETFEPLIAPSFGSTNQTLFDFLRKMAKEEGFFLDPIYSGKLFYSLPKDPPSGNRLIIHSGGALTLSGFQ